MCPATHLHARLVVRWLLCCCADCSDCSQLLELCCPSDWPVSAGMCCCAGLSACCLLRLLLSCRVGQLGGICRCADLCGLRATVCICLAGWSGVCPCRESMELCRQGVTVVLCTRYTCSLGALSAPAHALSTAAFAGLPCSRVGWCKRLHAACALLGGESPRVLSLPKGLAVRDRLGISEGCSLARVPEAAWP
jgi:hypothetical protein